MCTSMKRSYTRLSFNINDVEDIEWNQYGGTGGTPIANIQSRMNGNQPSQKDVPRLVLVVRMVSQLSLSWGIGLIEVSTV